MNRKNNYRQVKQLPKSALSVPSYAVSINTRESYVYRLWRQHVDDGKEISFEIVTFQGYNFVIPKTTSPV